MLRELVDGFAHEVKNPLTSIKVALKVLGEKMAHGDPRGAIMEQIHNEVGTINRALSDLVDFTRMSPPEASLVGINEPIEKALRRIQADCKRQDVRVEKLLSPDLPDTRIDARQVELAFLHLFLDMLKVMPHGGHMWVQTSFNPGSNILVELEDSGGPIPQIQMERLFKPFLSTKGRGTGIGLSVAKKVIAQNGGHIEAKNKGEEGMTFHIVFPICS